MNIPAIHKPEELQRQALKGKQVGSKRSGKRIVFIALPSGYLTNPFRKASLMKIIG
jgi:hypothetical protein